MRSPLRHWPGMAICAAVAMSVAACGDDDPDDATVSFREPADGVTVAGRVQLSMGADGIIIEEAGEVRDGAGHFHVIADDGCVEPGQAVPRDADHVHFGAGQAEGTIYLEPGIHELCLQAGDGGHIALDATDTVTVDVGISNRDQWCTVSDELDELFSAAEAGGDDFPAVQVTYENIRRLLAQVADAMDEVDADLRQGVSEHLDDASTIATAFIEAHDEDAAVAAMMEAFGPEGIDFDSPGRAAVAETCEPGAGG